MNPMPDDFEVKRLQLMAGLISVPDVIAWADSIILESDEPENALIDLALSGKAPPADIVYQLQKLSEGCDRFQVIRVVLGQMHHALLQNQSLARGFARILEHWAMENVDSLPKDLYFMWGMEDDFSLVDLGYATVDQIIEKFIEILREFDTL